MTHEEQRVWLIRELLSEKPEYRRYRIPEDGQEQKNLLRLMPPTAKCWGAFSLCMDVLTMQYYTKSHRHHKEER